MIAVGFPMDTASGLPVESLFPQIIAALKGNPACILQAPTGSGKTTRVPPALLRSGLLGPGKLLMLQPRRVAARACAKHMASLFGEPVGARVGYQIRFERKGNHNTKIWVITEGILSRRFVDDPLLDGVSLVVLDEFHERSIHTDLALAFLKELLQLRDDLKLLVMSATLEAEPLAKFLFNCPILKVKVRKHPLAIDYQPHQVNSPLGSQVAQALDQLMSDPADDGGNILVFLPGAPEIRSVLRFLQQRSIRAQVVPLHGSLSNREQDLALSPGKQRRIILATNIAETSLTLPGVTAVIDSGWCKSLIYDQAKGIPRLDLVRISQASAAQRAGRAGREGPGRVIRLWSQEYQLALSPQETPEIMRSDLSGPLLQVLDFHGPQLEQFPFFERPPKMALERSIQTLVMLGAVDATWRLTELGRHLNGLPLHPRIGALLQAGSRTGFLSEAIRVAALLSESGRALGDFELFTVATRGFSASEPRFRQVETQLKKMSSRSKPANRSASFDHTHLAKILLAGFPDRLCRVRARGQGLMVGGRGVSFDQKPGGPGFDFFLALDLMERGKDRTSGKVGFPVALSFEVIQETLPLKKRDRARFDSQRRSVIGVRQWVFQDLVLLEKSTGSADPKILSETLAQHACQDFHQVFKPQQKARNLLSRIRFAARNLSEMPWPDVTQNGLKAILANMCVGKRNYDQLLKLDWYSILLNLLDWQQRPLLDREVPEKIKVPSGTMATIDYEPALAEDGLPVLAIRIQEVFGLADTPRLAQGRVPLVFHLLAPNMRPAQMTQDLRHFWNETYFEVRKELRQRYPKHYWPEDPWQAQAIRGVRRKRK